MMRTINVLVVQGVLFIVLTPTNLHCFCIAKAKLGKMKREDFRNTSALLILTVLLDKTTNPAKAAVMWADELVKELYDDDKKTRRNNRH
jgi:hypothetical protein